MFERRLIEKITKLKVIKNKRKEKKNIIYTIKMIIIKKKLKLFHFDNYALTMTLLSITITKHQYY